MEKENLNIKEINNRVKGKKKLRLESEEFNQVEIQQQ